MFKEYRDGDKHRECQQVVDEVLHVATFHFDFLFGDLAGLRLNGLTTTAKPWWSTLICFCRAMSIAFAITLI